MGAFIIQIVLYVFTIAVMIVLYLDIEKKLREIKKHIKNMEAILFKDNSEGEPLKGASEVEKAIND